MSLSSTGNKMWLFHKLTVDVEFVFPPICSGETKEVFYSDFESKRISEIWSVLVDGFDFQACWFDCRNSPEIISNYTCGRLKSFENV